jgi:hypothetical protein
MWLMRCGVTSAAHELYLAETLNPNTETVSTVSVLAIGAGLLG